MISIKKVRKKHKGASLSMPKAGRVKVGFPASKASADVIMRAVYNHYGTETIPERPFLANAMRNNAAKYRSKMRVAAEKIFNGDYGTNRALMKLGALAQGDVQQEITDLRTPANALSTIDQKGSSNPLIDSGEMRQSVTWAIDD